jgi:peroxiredoxin
MLGLAVVLIAVAGVVLFLQLSTPADPYNVAGPIAFHDQVESNGDVTEGQLDLTFVNAEGQQVRLADLRGKKNVVLVMTRGYHLARCPYCTAQTSRLAANYAAFAERDAEVLVVYPGPLDHVDEFVSAVKADAKSDALPFPLLYDEDFAGVDKLNIRWQLARPSTFILDKEGQLRFAYIGKDIADRPSVAAMLKQLDAFAAAGQPAP